MRLMDSRIKVLHGQRKIHGVQVVEVMASKDKASDGNCARKKDEGQPLPINHVENGASGWPFKAW